MDILTIFFLFMISTSLTLTGFVIRQRRNNKMLGELVAQSKVNNQSKYSKINVGVRNREYVTKCPACAEWVNLEAKICKSCQSNVEDHNQKIKQEMKQIDLEITQSKLDKEAQNRERRRMLLKNPIFRITSGVLIAGLIFFLVTSIQSTIRFQKGTSMPPNAAFVVQNWDSKIAECGFAKGTDSPKTVEDNGWVSLDFQLESSLDSFNWGSETGKKIICFSEKALGFDVSKKLNSNTVNNIDLPNGYSLFGSYDRSYIAFYWD